MPSNFNEYPLTYGPHEATMRPYGRQIGGGGNIDNATLNPLPAKVERIIDFGTNSITSTIKDALTLESETKDVVVTLVKSEDGKTTSRNGTFQ